MTDLIKMNIFRLFKHKGFYIIHFVQLILIAIVTFVAIGTGDMVNNDNYDILEAFSSIVLPAMFVAVYGAIFTLDDFNSGYIKNIGGQVKTRSMVILSKAVALAVSGLTFFVLYVIEELSILLAFGVNLKVNNIKSVFGYLAVQSILMMTMSIFCMMVAFIIKKSAIAITVCVIIGGGMIEELLTGLINDSVRQSVADFDLARYTILGNINGIHTFFPLGEQAPCAFIVCVCFIVVSIALSCTVMKKRDIV